MMMESKDVFCRQKLLLVLFEKMNEISFLNITKTILEKDDMQLHNLFIDEFTSYISMSQKLTSEIALMLINYLKNQAFENNIKHYKNSEKMLGLYISLYKVMQIKVVTEDLKTYLKKFIVKKTHLDILKKTFPAEQILSYVIECKDIDLYDTSLSGTYYLKYKEVYDKGTQGVYDLETEETYNTITHKLVEINYDSS